MHTKCPAKTKGAAVEIWILSRACLAQQGRWTLGAGGGGNSFSLPLGFGRSRKHQIIKITSLCFVKWFYADIDIFEGQKIDQKV